MHIDLCILAGPLHYTDHLQVHPMTAFARLKKILTSPDLVAAPASSATGSGLLREPYFTPVGILRWRSIVPPTPSGLSDFLAAMTIARQAGRHGQVAQYRSTRTDDGVWTLRDVKRREIAVVDMRTKRLVE